MFGRRWRSTSTSAASGSNSQSFLTVSHPTTQRYTVSLRAQTPRFASPPLSPERAPRIRPTGARTVAPSPIHTVTGFAVSTGRRSAATTVGTTFVVVPSIETTDGRCGTVDGQ